MTLYLVQVSYSVPILSQIIGAGELKNEDSLTAPVCGESIWILDPCCSSRPLRAGRLQSRQLHISHLIHSSGCSATLQSSREGTSIPHSEAVDISLWMIHSDDTCVGRPQSIITRLWCARMSASCQGRCTARARETCFRLSTACMLGWGREPHSNGLHYMSTYQPETAVFAPC